MKQNKQLEEVILTKVPPHSKDVEESVLGILLLEPAALYKALNSLSADFFYVPKHNVVFKAVQALYDKGCAIDILTVVNYVNENQQMNLVGGVYEIVKLTNNVVSSAHMGDWIKILQSRYLQRQGIIIGQELMMNSYNGGEADAVLNNASSLILKAQENVFRNTEKSMMHYLFNLAVMRDKTSKDGHIGINTGYSSLNALISGWSAPDLVILAARPAQGKTAFMLNTILNVLRQNIPVGIFSLEMSGEQLVNRLLSLDADISHTKLRHNDMNDAEMVRLKNSQGRLEKMPLFIDDTASVNIRDLRSKATIMKRKYNIQFLCVDYLQLMSGIDKRGNRETEIAEISRGCKIIAKELNIPVLALSQLSRAVESRADKMPQLSDLRESGGIEQDADSVIFLMRPETYGIKEIEIKGQTYGTDGVCVVKVGKNRHGSLKTLPFKFVGETMKFKEYEF